MTTKSRKTRNYLLIIAVCCMVFVFLTAVSFFEKTFFERKGGNALATGDCPGGYLYVDSGDFCIEEDLHEGPNNDVEWRDAALACVADDGARLCTAAEWTEACHLEAASEISLNDMTNQVEWVDEFISDTHVLSLGDGTCEGVDSRNFTNAVDEEFRCCKNGID